MFLLDSGLKSVVNLYSNLKTELIVAEIELNRFSILMAQNLSISSQNGNYSVPKTTFFDPNPNFTHSNTSNHTPHPQFIPSTISTIKTHQFQ